MYRHLLAKAQSMQTMTGTTSEAAPEGDHDPVLADVTQSRNGAMSKPTAHRALAGPARADIGPRRLQDAAILPPPSRQASARRHDGSAGPVSAVRCKNVGSDFRAVGPPRGESALSDRRDRPR